MKRIKPFHFFLCIICAAAIVTAHAPFFSASADTSEGGENTGEYVYTFNLQIDNPCDATSADEDNINVLYFDYYYKGQNGYQDEKKQTFDLSKKNSVIQNSDFWIEHFIRQNNSACSTSFDVTLPGKLTKVFIKLNMDGGERLSFTVKSIYCNGKMINSNSDYVSSAYFDSTATVYCSMEESIVDEKNSPYFSNHTTFDITERQINDIANGVDDGESYKGQFKDQYNSVIDTAVLKKCIATSDGDINQYFSHQGEESMYNYTFCLNVDNPIDLDSADYNEVEKFYFEIDYKDKNGYGEKKTYKLDMSYSDSLKRNLNQKYLSCFERYDDNEYQTQFSLWVPGIITEVRCNLNMSGEKLCFYVEKILLGSLQVNTGRDYVSSVYFDSDLKIKCAVPNSKIAMNEKDLPENYSENLTDQYGFAVSEFLFEKAKEKPQKYLYHQ